MNRLVDQLGAGPFFLVESVPLENVRSRGEPAELVHNSAFGCCGGGAIELMEIISSAPERVEERFSAPRPGIHHVAYVVSPAEVPEVRKSLDQRGLPQYLSLSSAKPTTPSMTPPHRWDTTSRSTTTFRGCVISSRWSGRRRGLGRLGTAAPGREQLIAAIRLVHASKPWA